MSQHRSAKFKADGQQRAAAPPRLSAGGPTDTAPRRSLPPRSARARSPITCRGAWRESRERGRPGRREDGGGAGAPADGGGAAGRAGGAGRRRGPLHQHCVHAGGESPAPARPVPPVARYAAPPPGPDPSSRGRPGSRDASGAEVMIVRKTDGAVSASAAAPEAASSAPPPGCSVPLCPALLAARPERCRPRRRTDARLARATPRSARPRGGWRVEG